MSTDVAWLLLTPLQKVKPFGGLVENPSISQKVTVSRSNPIAVKVPAKFQALGQSRIGQKGGFLLGNSQQNCPFQPGRMWPMSDVPRPNRSVHARLRHAVSRGNHGLSPATAAHTNANLGLQSSIDTQKWEGLVYPQNSPNI